MRNTILRILYGIAVFIITVLLLEKFGMNEADAVRESDLSGPHLAIVCFEEDGRIFNTLQGLTGQIDSGRYRSVLTPAGTDRTVRISIDPCGEGVSEVSYEVRSLDGSRLIENGRAETSVDEKGILHTVVSLKDLIETGREYLFVVQVTGARAQPAKYYTRLICSDSDLHREALDFVQDFHERSLDETQESFFRTYLETQGSEEKDLSETDIHSSAEEVTFYSLGAEDVTAPSLFIDSIRGSTAILHTEGILMLSDGQDGMQRQVFCREYYRIRKGAERFFLLEYKRTLEEIPDLADLRETQDYFDLGITAQAEGRAASAGSGGAAAFASCGNLYMYYPADNELVTVYGFRDEEIRDRREMDRQHDIRILNIDGSGNVSFLAYGYMSSGAHEGRIGISVYQYTHAGRTLTEQAFIEYGGSFELLRAQIERTAYLQQGGRLYLLLDRQLCALDTLTGSAEILLPEIGASEVWSSQSGRYAAWISKDDPNTEGDIILLDLDDLTRKSIEAGEGEKLTPIGFRGDDFIYGTASLSDARTDQIGTAYYPMYNIRIVDFGLHILADYEEEDILISDCEETETQIILHRLVRKVSETGEVIYEPTDDDQIMKTTAAASPDVRTQVQQDPAFGKTQRIPLRGFTLQGLRLTGAVGTGSGTVQQDLLESGSGDTQDNAIHRYYLYGTFGFEEEYTDEAEAVRRASQSGNTVIDGSGRYIWETPAADRCQLTGFHSDLEGSRSAAEACADAMLRHEGIYAEAAGDNTEAGGSPASILGQADKELQILQLTGCSFDAVLYYPSAGYPVLAATAEEEGAILILGYGPERVAVYDPAAGGETLIGREEARALCEAGGNRYITYIR